MLNQRLIGFSAWITLFIFAFSELTGMGMPRAFAAIAPREVKLPPAFDLNLSPELGTIQAIHHGQGPTLIHIQTAHGNYQAQKSIQSILHFLRDEYAVDTVFVEGSAVPLDPEMIRYFPDDRELTMEIVDDLTRKSLIRGVERFLLEEPSARAFGIEDLKTYRNNLDLFRRVLQMRATTGQFLDQMDMQVERLASAYMPQSMRRILVRKADFESGKVDLLSWIEFLRTRSLDVLALDLQDPANQLDWPMLIRILKLREFQSKIQTRALKAEREAFLQAFSNALGRAGVKGHGHAQRGSEILGQVTKILHAPLSRHELPDPGTGLLFESMVELLPADFDYESFPQIRYLIGHLILQSEIKAGPLMAEVERLAEMMMTTLAEDEAQIGVWKLLKGHGFLKRLFALELTPDAYKHLQENEELKPSAVARRFEELNRDGRVKNLRFDHLKEIDALYDAALDFYAIVRERDRHMLQNISNQMSERGMKKAAVITGGFHAAPFERHFKNSGFSYAQIIPRIEELKGDGGKAAYVRSVFQDSKNIFTESTMEGATLAASLSDRMRHGMNLPWVIGEETESIISRAGGRLAHHPAVFKRMNSRIQEHLRLDYRPEGRINGRLIRGRIFADEFSFSIPVQIQRTTRVEMIASSLQDLRPQFDRLQSSGHLALNQQVYRGSLDPSRNELRTDQPLPEMPETFDTPEGALGFLLQRNDEGAFVERLTALRRAGQIVTSRGDSISGAQFRTFFHKANALDGFFEAVPDEPRTVVTLKKYIPLPEDTDSITVRGSLLGLLEQGKPEATTWSELSRILTLAYPAYSEISGQNIERLASALDHFFEAVPDEPQSLATLQAFIPGFPRGKREKDNKREILYDALRRFLNSKKLRSLAERGKEEKPVTWTEIAQLAALAQEVYLPIADQPFYRTAAALDHFFAAQPRERHTLGSVRYYTPDPPEELTRRTTLMAMLEHGKPADVSWSEMASLIAIARTEYVPVADRLLFHMGSAADQVFSGNGEGPQSIEEIDPLIPEAPEPLDPYRGLLALLKKGKPDHLSWLQLAYMSALVDEHFADLLESQKFVRSAHVIDKLGVKPKKKNKNAGQYLERFRTQIREIADRRYFSTLRKKPATLEGLVTALLEASIEDELPKMVQTGPPRFHHETGDRLTGLSPSSLFDYLPTNAHEVFQGWVDQSNETRGVKPAARKPSPKKKGAAQSPRLSDTKLPQFSVPEEALRHLLESRSTRSFNQRIRRMANRRQLVSADGESLNLSRIQAFTFKATALDQVFQGLPQSQRNRRGLRALYPAEADVSSEEALLNSLLRHGKPEGLTWGHLARVVAVSVPEAISAATRRLEMFAKVIDGVIDGSATASERDRRFGRSYGQTNEQVLLSIRDEYLSSLQNTPATLEGMVIHYFDAAVHARLPRTSRGRSSTRLPGFDPTKLAPATFLNYLPVLAEEVFTPWIEAHNTGTDVREELRMDDAAALPRFSTVQGALRHILENPDSRRIRTRMTELGKNGQLVDIKTGTALGTAGERLQFDLSAKRLDLFFESTGLARDSAVLRKLIPRKVSRWNTGTAIRRLIEKGKPANSTWNQMALLAAALNPDYEILDLQTFNRTASAADDFFEKVNPDEETLGVIKQFIPRVPRKLTHASAIRKLLLSEKPEGVTWAHMSRLLSVAYDGYAPVQDSRLGFMSHAADLFFEKTDESGHRIELLKKHIPKPPRKKQASAALRALLKNGKQIDLSWVYFGYLAEVAYEGYEKTAGEGFNRLASQLDHFFEGVPFDQQNYEALLEYIPSPSGPLTPESAARKIVSGQRTKPEHVTWSMLLHLAPVAYDAYARVSNESLGRLGTTVDNFSAAVPQSPNMLNAARGLLVHPSAAVSRLTHRPKNPDLVRLQVGFIRDILKKGKPDNLSYSDFVKFHAVTFEEFEMILNEPLYRTAHALDKLAESLKKPMLSIGDVQAVVPRAPDLLTQVDSLLGFIEAGKPDGLLFSHLAYLAPVIDDRYIPLVSKSFMMRAHALDHFAATLGPEDDLQEALRKQFPSPENTHDIEYIAMAQLLARGKHPVITWNRLAQLFAVAYRGHDILRSETLERMASVFDNLGKSGVNKGSAGYIQADKYAARYADSDSTALKAGPTSLRNLAQAYFDGLGDQPATLEGIAIHFFNLAVEDRLPKEQRGPKRIGPDHQPKSGLSPGSFLIYLPGLAAEYFQPWVKEHNTGLQQRDELRYELIEAGLPDTEVELLLERGRAVMESAHEELHKVLFQVARQGTPALNAIRKENGEGWLTIADTAVQQAILNRIRQHYPDHHIIAEEDMIEKDRVNNAANSVSPYKWIIDPIDGTGQLRRGNNYYAISISLYHEGRPVFALVYSPEFNAVIEASVLRPGVLVRGAEQRVSRSQKVPKNLRAVISGETKKANRLRTFLNNELSSKRAIKKLDLTERTRSTVVTGARLLVGDDRLHLAGHLQGKGAINIWDLGAIAYIVEKAGGTFLSVRNGKTEPVLDVMHRDIMAGKGAIAKYQYLAGTRAVAQWALKGLVKQPREELRSLDSDVYLHKALYHLGLAVNTNEARQTLFSKVKREHELWKSWPTTLYDDLKSNIRNLRSQMPVFLGEKEDFNFVHRIDYFRAKRQSLDEWVQEFDGFFSEGKISAMDGPDAELIAEAEDAYRKIKEDFIIAGDHLLAGAMAMTLDMLGRIRADFDRPPDGGPAISAVDLNFRDSDDGTMARITTILRAYGLRFTQDRDDIMELVYSFPAYLEGRLAGHISEAIARNAIALIDEHEDIIKTINNFPYPDERMELRSYSTHGSERDALTEALFQSHAALKGALPDYWTFRNLSVTVKSQLTESLAAEIDGAFSRVLEEYSLLDAIAGFATLREVLAGVEYTFNPEHEYERGMDNYHQHIFFRAILGYLPRRAMIKFFAGTFHVLVDAETSPYLNFGRSEMIAASINHEFEEQSLLNIGSVLRIDDQAVIDINSDEDYWLSRHERGHFFYRQFVRHLSPPLPASKPVDIVAKVKKLNTDEADAALIEEIVQDIEKRAFNVLRQEFIVTTYSGEWFEAKAVDGIENDAFERQVNNWVSNHLGRVTFTVRQLPALSGPLRYVSNMRLGENIAGQIEERLTQKFEAIVRDLRPLYDQKLAELGSRQRAWEWVSSHVAAIPAQELFESGVPGKREELRSADSASPREIAEAFLKERQQAIRNHPIELQPLAATPQETKALGDPIVESFGDVHMGNPGRAGRFDINHYGGIAGYSDRGMLNNTHRMRVAEYNLDTGHHLEVYDVPVIPEETLRNNGFHLFRVAGEWVGYHLYARDFTQGINATLGGIHIFEEHRGRQGLDFDPAEVHEISLRLADTAFGQVDDFYVIKGDPNDLYGHIYSHEGEAWKTAAYLLNRGFRPSDQTEYVDDLIVQLENNQRLEQEEVEWLLENSADTLWHLDMPAPSPRQELRSLAELEDHPRYFKERAWIEGDLDELYRLYPGLEDAVASRRGGRVAIIGSGLGIEAVMLKRAFPNLDIQTLNLENIYEITFDGKSHAQVLYEALVKKGVRTGFFKARRYSNWLKENFVQRDVNQGLPSEWEGRFDVVIAGTNTVMYVDEKKELIEAIYKALKPGGIGFSETVALAVIHDKSSDSSFHQNGFYSHQVQTQNFEFFRRFGRDSAGRKVIIPIHKFAGSLKGGRIFQTDPVLKIRRFDAAATFSLPIEKTGTNRGEPRIYAESLYELVQSEVREELRRTSDGGNLDLAAFIETIAKEADPLNRSVLDEYLPILRAGISPAGREVIRQSGKDYHRARAGNTFYFDETTFAYGPFDELLHTFAIYYLENEAVKMEVLFAKSGGEYNQKIRELELEQNAIFEAVQLLLDRYHETFPEQPRLTPAQIFIHALSVYFEKMAVSKFIELRSRLRYLPGEYGYRAVALQLFLSGMHLRGDFTEEDVNDITHVNPALDFALHELEHPGRINALGEETAAEIKKLLRLGVAKLAITLEPVWDRQRDWKSRKPAHFAYFIRVSGGQYAEEWLQEAGKLGQVIEFRRIISTHQDIIAGILDESLNDFDEESTRFLIALQYGMFPAYYFYLKSQGYQGSVEDLMKAVNTDEMKNMDGFPMLLLEGAAESVTRREWWGKVKKDPETLFDHIDAQRATLLRNFQALRNELRSSDFARLLTEPLRRVSIAFRDRIIPYRLFREFSMPVLVEAVSTILGGRAVYAETAGISKPRVQSVTERHFGHSDVRLSGAFRQGLMAAPQDASGQVLLDQTLLEKLLAKPKAILELVEILQELRTVYQLDATPLAFSVRKGSVTHRDILQGMLNAQSRLSVLERSRAGRFDEVLLRGLIQLVEYEEDETAAVNGFIESRQFGVATLTTAFNENILPGANLVLAPDDINEQDAHSLAAIILALRKAAALTQGIKDPRLRFERIRKALPDILPGIVSNGLNQRAFILSQTEAFTQALINQGVIESSA